FGNPYSHSKIIEIIKEGEFRYANFLPPGYMDQKDKLGFQKYADLIIWKQIIEYSNNEKKPIILIMDDLKEDWWVLDKKRKPIMPRPELIEEIRESGNAEFWMYTISDFLKKFPELIEETTIQEVQNVTDNRDELYNGKILLTAHRSREEPFRIKRLQNVANFLELIIGIDNLLELNDYKGILTATWKTKPTDFEKSSIELGWEHENEPRVNVCHETAANSY
ncbi:MAG TPA: PIN-like domain-containing protein, partial [Flavobacterium sp.]|nr:PIN-like domain-containing protein [Flavobacterium sp.]